MDPDGDTLAWSDDTDLFDIGAETGAIAFSPTQADVGTHRVNVTVSDGQGGTLTVSFDVVVVNVNDAPVANITRPTSGERLGHGEALELEATATDEDGDALEYTWKEGSRVLGTGRLAKVKDLGEGRHVITLIVDDGMTTTTASVTIEVEGGGAGSGTMLYLVIAIAVVVLVVLVAVLVMRRRSQGGGESPESAPQADVAQAVGPPPQA